MGSAIKNSSNDENFAPRAVRICIFTVHGIEYFVAVVSVIARFDQLKPLCYRVARVHEAYNLNQRDIILAVRWPSIKTDSKIGFF